MDRDRFRVEVVAVAASGSGRGAMLDGLDPKTVAPVLRELGRSFCFALSERLPLGENSGAVLAVEVVALRKSEGNAVSALVDLAVPGPARLPVGLGGLSVRLRLLEEGRPLVLYAWSRGANSLRENARLSPIADAWQLASRFPADFLRDTGLRNLLKRPAPERQADRARCEARFGKSDPVLRGAGRLLPLPPEWSEDATPAEDAPASEPEAPEAQMDSEEDRARDRGAKAHRAATRCARASPRGSRDRPRVCRCARDRAAASADAQEATQPPETPGRPRQPPNRTP